MNDDLKRLHNKASALIARRPYSRGEMRLKLLKFADGDSVDTALGRLEQLKLLNDSEYAYNFALYRADNEGWGPVKIRNSLFRRHVHPSDIARALSRVRGELGDDYGLGQYLRRYFAKREHPRDAQGVRSLVDHLLRRGHYRSIILENLGGILPAKTMKYFETGD